VADLSTNELKSLLLLERQKNAHLIDILQSLWKDKQRLEMKLENLTKNSEQFAPKGFHLNSKKIHQNGNVNGQHKSGIVETDNNDNNKILPSDFKVDQIEIINQKKY